MATVHIFLFELLERAYAFAPYAEANNDLEDYLGFAETSLSQICEHHELEGEPNIETERVIAADVLQRPFSIPG